MTKKLNPLFEKDILQSLKQYLEDTSIIGHPYSEKGKELYIRESIKSLLRQTIEMFCREECFTLSIEDIETYRKEINYLIDNYKTVIQEQQKEANNHE